MGIKAVMGELDKEEEKSLFLIGKFSVIFQQLLERLIILDKFIFSVNGLKDVRLLDGFLFNVTAMPILETTRSIFNQYYKPTSDDKKITEDIFKKIIDIIKIRNEIQHGTLYIGWTTDKTDFSEFEKYNIKRKSDGVYSTFETITNTDLEKNIEEINELVILVNAMLKYFTAKHLGNLLTPTFKDYIEIERG